MLERHVFLIGMPGSGKSSLGRKVAANLRLSYTDMDRKIAENHIHAAVFCSPHNPCGRVWERQELETAMELFRRHFVRMTLNGQSAFAAEDFQ